MKTLLSQLHIFLSRLTAFFSAEKQLHTARFARLHELTTLLSDTVDGVSLLLGKSFYNHVLKVQPTKTQKELANLFLVARSRGGKGLNIETNLLTWPSSAIVNDIKRELHRRTAGFREKGLEGKVFVFDPRGYGHR